jgi:hypothetical protein
MRASQIIPVEELAKAALLFDALAPGASFGFTVHHKRRTKMLSWQRPRPC